MAFLGEHWGWKHTGITLLIIFVGVAMVRRNTFGIPATVDNLVGSVLAPLGSFGIK